ncbi:MAG TPA: TIGR03435 family protein [Vicinamibacterales bacterium]|nr:TIGR03435 family protein [Vicinamibacterales bacterium]
MRSMSAFSTVFFAASLIASPLAQQPNTTFEVVSIKRASFPRDDFRGYVSGVGMCGFWRFTPAGNRVSFGEVDVCSLLRMAFDVTDYQIVAPAWITEIDPSVWFQIDARAQEGKSLTLDQARAMMRSMMADRFKLTYHWDKRPARVYALSVSPQGHKLGDLESPCQRPDVPAVFSTAAGPTMCMSIPQLMVDLRRRVDRPIIDRTGLTGRYAIARNWSGREPWAPVDPSDASVFTAVRERFGLRLDPANDPVDTLIIDHIERPTPN